MLASLTSLQDSGFSWVTPADAIVGEFKEMLQTDAFIRAVIEQTDLEKELADNPGEADQMYQNVRTAIWVQALGNNLIQIGTTHGNAQIAHQLATATINTYLQWKINTDLQESISAQAFFADLLKRTSLIWTRHGRRCSRISKITLPPCAAIGHPPQLSRCAPSKLKLPLNPWY